MGTVHNLDAARRSRKPVHRPAAHTQHGVMMAVALPAPQEWDARPPLLTDEPQPDVLKLAMNTMIRCALLVTTMAACFGFDFEYQILQGAGGFLMHALFLASTCIGSVFWIVSYILWLLTRD